MAKTIGAKLRQPANKMLDAENKDGVTAKFLTGDGRTVTIYGGIVTEVSEKEARRPRVMRGNAATKGNRRQ